MPGDKTICIFAEILGAGYVGHSGFEKPADELRLA